MTGTAPMPALGVHVAPESCDTCGPPGTAGDVIVAGMGGAYQTSAEPSAATAIVPAELFDAGRLVLNGAHVDPPSVDRAPCGEPAFEPRPTRATTSGASSAKSMLSVVVNTGLSDMPPAGETDRSS